jgi:hypothetical protein
MLNENIKELLMIMILAGWGRKSNDPKRAILKSSTTKKSGGLASVNCSKQLKIREPARLPAAA